MPIDTGVSRTHATRAAIRWWHITIAAMARRSRQETWGISQTKTAGTASSTMSRTCGDYIDGLYPGIRHVLLGHSMGSYIAQSYLMRYPDATTALVLSGSTWPNRGEVSVARWLARIAIFFRGPRVAGTLFDRMSFGKFNQRFAPNRTTFDWLSRDDAEVDIYIADPLCGGPATSGLWRDLFTGLLEISKPASLARVPSSLPILIAGGEVDPVGGKAALTRLAEAYRQSGHDEVTLTLYDGARHEILNETNRDDVTRDLLDWIDSTSP